MSLFIRCERNGFLLVSKAINCSSAFCTKTSTNVDHVEKEFRVLEIMPKKSETKRSKRLERLPVRVRADEMPVDQDWPSVWPAARTFHPAVVPLPVRQGYPKNNDAPPYKYGNAELMKIPNFLHLTPPAIRRHCEALKQFCTEWPKGLETDEKCDKHFPVEYIYSDYCYSSPTIREPLARIVSLRVKLSNLKLDNHAKDKLLRLLGPRHNPETDLITITADRCPVRKQNMEYVQYLLTAVYNESWRVEPWEAEKGLVDMEYYDWDTNKSRTNLVAIQKWPETPTDHEYDSIPHVTEYKEAVSDLINKGEDDFAVNKYKEAVKNFLHLRQ